MLIFIYSNFNRSEVASEVVTDLCDYKNVKVFAFPHKKSLISMDLTALSFLFVWFVSAHDVPTIVFLVFILLNKIDLFQLPTMLIFFPALC